MCKHPAVFGWRDVCQLSESLGTRLCDFYEQAIEAGERVEHAFCILQ